MSSLSLVVNEHILCKKNYVYNSRKWATYAVMLEDLLIRVTGASELTTT